MGSRLCRLIYSVSLCVLLFVSSFLLLCGTPYPPWRHRVRGRILTCCRVYFFPSSVPQRRKGNGPVRGKCRSCPKAKMCVINFYTFTFKKFRIFVTFASLFVSNIMKALHKGALVHELYGGLPLPPGPRLRRKALLIPPVAGPAVLWHRPCCRWIFCLWFCVRRYSRAFYVSLYMLHSGSAARWILILYPVGAFPLPQRTPAAAFCIQKTTRWASGSKEA